MPDEERGSCSNCGETTTKDLCDACEELVACDNCNELFDVEDMLTAFGDTVCGDCFHELVVVCCRCDEYMRPQDVYSCTEDSSPYCESCYTDMWWYCSECECDHERGEDCPRNHTEFHGLDVHPFNYRPAVRIHKHVEDPPRAPACGFELEIEFGNADYRNDRSAAQLLRKLSDLLYIKRDGSLVDGVEIVSEPMTYRAFKNRSNEILLLLQKFEELGYDTRCPASGRETCGMHVHISRQAFSDLGVFKLMSLIYSDEKFLTALSGRKTLETLRQYACPDFGRAMIMMFGNVFGPKKDKQKWDAGKKSLMIQQVRRRFHAGRYWAINIEPRHTVELRFFASTLEGWRFLANMQSVWALHEFVSRHSIEQMHWPEFQWFAERSAKQYPELAAVIGQLSA